MNKDWEAHNRLAGKTNLPPAETLMAALAHMGEALPYKYAADLGCGAGADTFALLQRGWQVFAMDKDQHSIMQLKTTAGADKLTAVTQELENLLLPEVFLVNASFSLPFCIPLYFAGCWQQILHAIIPGGYFCGHFLGPDDSWSSRADMTFHTAAQVEQLFTLFDIVWQKEVKKEGKTIDGKDKYWHIHAVVARKW